MVSSPKRDCIPERAESALRQSMCKHELHRYDHPKTFEKAKKRRTKKTKGNRTCTALLVRVYTVEPSEVINAVTTVALERPNQTRTLCFPTLRFDVFTRFRARRGYSLGSLSYRNGCRGCRIRCHSSLCIRSPGRKPVANPRSL